MFNIVAVLKFQMNGLKAGYKFIQFIKSSHVETAKRALGQHSNSRVHTLLYLCVVHREEVDYAGREVQGDQGLSLQDGDTVPVPVAGPGHATTENYEVTPMGREEKPKLELRRFYVCLSSNQDGFRL